jgi:hypothetical protein
MDISVEVIKQFYPDDDSIYLPFITANCIVAGVAGHMTCGWCPKCNKPVSVCEHPRPPNPMLENKTMGEIQRMQEARDAELGKYFRMQFKDEI